MFEFTAHEKNNVTKMAPLFLVPIRRNLFSIKR